LFLLAEEKEFSEETLIAMSENSLFREHPEMLDEVLLSIHNKKKVIQFLEGDLRAYSLKNAFVNWGYRNLPQFRKHGII